MPRNRFACGAAIQAPAHEAPAPLSRRPSSRWVGLASVVGVVVLAAGSFLPKQVLWLDESTQMSGLTLGPISSARWLAGAESHDFGQFRDRMPPLGYWVGWCWSRLFGLEERPMRWLGVVAVAAAAGLVYEASRRAFGTAPAWLAGLGFALSPSVIVLAVEIRAYPLFLLESAASFFFLIRLLGSDSSVRPRRLDLEGLSLALAAAIATHFFGLVLAAGVLSLLCDSTLRRGGSWRPVLAVAAVVGLAAMAVSPFVFRAMEISATPGAGEPLAMRMKAVGTYLTGLNNHQALAVWGPAAAGVRVSTGVLLVMSVSLALAGRRNSTISAILLVLGVGVVITTVARLLLRGFDATTLNYSAWMLPGLFIAISAALAGHGRLWRRLAVCATVALVLSEGVGAVLLVRHGEHFAHGPHATIAGLVRRLTPEGVAVVHDDPSPHLVFVSCPLRYAFGTRLSQYQTLDETAPGRATVRRYRQIESPPPAPAEAAPVGVETLPHRYLIVVHCRYTTAGDLLRGMHSGAFPFGEGPAARRLRKSPDWTAIGSRSVLALDSAVVTVFKRDSERGQNVLRR